jgi:hypothetical protein
LPVPAGPSIIKEGMGARRFLAPDTAILMI